MNDPVLKFQKLFSNAVSPVQIAMLYNNNEYRPYRCIYSSSLNYYLDKNYDLYDLAPLLRTLCKKSGILSNDLYKNLFNNEFSGHLCYLLEWEDFNRKILLFDLSNTSHFDNNQFVNIIGESTDILLSLFNTQLEKKDAE